VVSGTTVRALVPGRFGQKNENNRFERYGQRINKNISNYIGGWCSGPPMSALGLFCSAGAGFFDLTLRVKTKT